MKLRPSLVAAVAVSLLLHALIGWMLTRLRSPHGELPRAAASPTFVLLPKLHVDQEPPGKLMPGDTGSPPIAGPSEWIVPIAKTSGPALGPAVLESSIGSAVAPAGAGSVGAAPLPAGVCTTFFDLPARGLKVVYVLDRSCSMGPGDALGVARRELIASLLRLPVAASFQVIVFNSSPLALAGPYDQFLPATAENIRQVIAMLDAVAAEGSTQHAPALQMALTLHPDIVFFLTDVDDLTAADLAKARQCNRSRSVIHTIELSQQHLGRSDMPMQRLAQETGGAYRAVNLLH